MRRLTALVSSALLLALFCGTAAGADPVLERLQASAAGVRTLQSDFVQEKHLAIFNEVLTSRGTFFFERPDRLRWEIVEPVKTGFVLDGGTGRRWHERTSRSEPFSLDREPVMRLVAEQLIAWAGADFERLQRQYRIQVVAGEPAVLRLEPLGEGQGFLDHLKVSFAPGGEHVSAVEVHEKDGDFTRIRFVDSRVNAPLPAGTF